MFPKEPDRLIGVDSFQDIHVKITQIHTQTGVILLHIRKYNMRTASIKNIITTVLRNIHTAHSTTEGFLLISGRTVSFLYFWKQKQSKFLNAGNIPSKGICLGYSKRTKKKLWYIHTTWYQLLQFAKKKFDGRVDTSIAQKYRIFTIAYSTVFGFTAVQNLAHKNSWEYCEHLWQEAGMVMSRGEWCAHDYREWLWSTLAGVYW